MPYDRKTELLWNYIGIAQFSDLFRVWGQGPARANSVPSDNRVQDHASVVRIETGSDNPANTRADIDVGPPSGTASGAEGFHHIDSGPEEPFHHASPLHLPHIPVEGYAGSHSLGMSASGFTRFDHQYTTGHSPPAQVAQNPENSVSNEENNASEGNNASPSSGPHDNPPVAEEPKIYGPSEVHMEAVIVNGGNTQTNVVITSGGNAVNGWSDLGEETIGNLVEQVKAPDEGSPFHLVVDYVSGNLTSLTTFTQLNTIYDGDINGNIVSVSAGSQSLIGNAAVAQTIYSGGNQGINTATLVGNQALDGYDVLVVTGDMTKINKIMQVNLIVDDDVNTTVAHADLSTPYGSASSVWDAAIQSGGNVEINIGFIIDQQSGFVYLVGGFYGSSHSATQFNVLSDADLNDILQLFHSQEGTGFLGFDVGALIASGGNSQTSVAGFIGSDEDGHADDGTAPSLSDLTSLLFFAGLHPEEGDVRVLFIDGNYTVINLVVQINVIQDSDSNTHVITAEGAMGALSPTETQTAESADSADSDIDGPTSNSSGSVSHEETAHEADDVSGQATASASGQGPDAGTDISHPTGNSLPVYADHGSLNYDQLTSSGGNEAGNYAVLIDGGNGPRLQIVQGNYTEYNEIYQINVLLDADHNRVIDTMNSETPAASGESDVPDSSHLVSADDILHKMMT